MVVLVLDAHMTMHDLTGSADMSPLLRTVVISVTLLYVHY